MKQPRIITKACSGKWKNVIRPHPYLDAPYAIHDNVEEVIPEVTMGELLSVVGGRKLKKSRDAHGLSSHLLKFLDPSHWTFLLGLFNSSFTSACLPSAWKDTRMILLPKKRSDLRSGPHTRPISILDSFQKIAEKLFLARFKKVLVGRGLLPLEQSGFREGYRLQTRLLLFLEDLCSLKRASVRIPDIPCDYVTGGIFYFVSLSVPSEKSIQFLPRNPQFSRFDTQREKFGL